VNEFAKRLIAIIATALALAAAAASVAPAAARAEPLNGQRACMRDTLAVCSRSSPEREHAGACLVANQSRIAPVCRAAVKNFTPRTAAAR
jgi:Spy/CpxP family protein refolding chaperone